MKNWFWLVAMGLFVVCVPGTSFAADWVNVGFPEANIKAVYVNPQNNQQIFASLNNGLSNQIFFTQNGGTAWTQSTMSGSGAISTSCNSFLVNKSNSKEVWAGCNPGLFRSIDGGANFKRVEPKFSYSNITEIVYDSSGYIYVNYDKNYLARSVDGLIWESLRVPGSTTNQRLFIDLPGDAVYVSRYGGVGFGLYRSYDKGTTWSLINNNQNINGGLDTLVVSGARICGSNTLGIICSSDNGLSWAAPAKPNNENLLGQRFYRIVQNPDIPENQLVLTGKWDGTDMRLYSYSSESALGEMVTVPNMVTEVVISQGVTYTWAPNTNWLKGISRNDGIAIVPEYLKKHPVIIVPGILGSWRVTDASGFQLDPIFHTYDGLVDAFQQNGFITGEDLFTFPYNWRNDNNITAALLKEKILEVRRISGKQKVDIVAHSMGGLVTRAYAESDNYEDDINKIIFLGTPHLGSPSSYPVWESGDVGFNGSLPINIVARYYFGKEASHSGYTGENKVFKYIQEKVPSIGQLLPVFDYLKNYNSADFIAYPSSYPRNIFLENLDNNKDVIKSRGIAVTNIVIDNISTVTGFLLAPFNGFSELWEHGIPYKYDADQSGIFEGVGDGTVPINSATGVEGDIIYLKGVEHSGIPNNAAKDVLAALDIRSVTLKTIQTINEYLIVKAYSPIDFYIQAPDGKRVGFNKNSGIVNEIEGAFYSGNETETEFLVIPNPQKGQYKVVATGTGYGEYKIETTYTDENLQKEITGSYIGDTVPGEEDVIISDLNSAAGEITVKIEDSVPPVTQALVGGEKQNDFYNTDVSVSLAASDDKSGVDKTEYSLDGLLWNTYSVPIMVTVDGTYTISYRSIDKNGNFENTQQLVFSRDAAPPSAEVTLSKNILTRWDKLLINCDITDAFSGVCSIMIESGGNNVSCGQSIALTEYATGSHAVNYRVTDTAGNEIVGSREFKVVVNYSSTLRDILSAYEMGAFKNHGSMVSLYVKVKTAQVFNSFGFETRSMALLRQASNELNSYYSREKLLETGYNLINNDFKYLMEGR